MSILLDKSYENILAAKVLITDPNDFHTASIHCSYYSCFQLVIYLLKYHHGYNDTRRYSNLGSTDGSHEETTKLLFAQLRESDKSQNPRDKIATHFIRYMETLRNMRTKADYKEDVIGPFESKFAYDEAMKLRQILINYYKLT